MSILKNSSIYLGSSFVNKAIPFLMLPVLTRYLSPHEYGILAIFQVFLSFVSPLVDLNISHNIARKFYGISKEALARYISNILLVLLSSFGVVSLLCAVIVLLFDNPFGVPDRWVLALPVIAFMNMVNKCNLAVLVLEKKPLSFGSFEIVNALTNVSISVILVVELGKGWEGRTSGMLIASILFGLFSLLYMRRRSYVKPSLNMVSVREILKVSLPLVPHLAGSVAIGFSDRLFIDHLVGREAVGLYEVGYKFGMITLLFADALIRAWTPWFFSKMNSRGEDVSVQVVKYSYLVVIAFFAASLFITAGSHVIFSEMVDARYNGARVLIIWIALAFATRGIYQLTLLYLIHEGKTSFLAYNTLVAVSINLIMNYFLIRINGIVGAAQATLIAFCVMSLGTWWYANRIHKMPWLSWRKLENITKCK